MRKAPANLFGEDKTKHPKTDGAKAQRPSERGKKGSEKNEKNGIWVGVHEINQMTRTTTVKHRSAARLHQEELKSLGASGPKKGATPMKIGRAMARKQKEISQKLKLRDRDTGMAQDKKVKDYWDSKLEKDEYLRKIKGNRSGLSHGNRVNTDALTGKYRDGVLTISKEDIEAIRSKRKR